MPENVTSLTAPLNLRQFLKTPDTRIDPVPFLDLLLIGLFFGLFNSQFILPPGLTIDLPRSNASAVTGTPVTAVITLLPPAPSDTQSLGFVLFRGDIIRQESLEGALAGYLRRKGADEQAVLLVKMDRRSSLAQLAAVAEAARASGFTALQIAADERPEPSEDLAP